MDTIFPRAVSPAQAAPILGLRVFEVVEMCRSGELAGALMPEGGPLAIPVTAIGAMIVERERNAFEIGKDYGRDLATLRA